MPEPLPRAAMRTSRGEPGSVDFEAGEGGFLYGVGGEDGLGYLLEVVELRAERCGEGGKDGDQLFRGKRDADDAGGGRKDFLGQAAEDFGGGVAGGARGGQTGFAGGAVGVAGVDGDYANMLPVARRLSLSTMSGAAMTRLEVNAAAALAGLSATMRAKSVRPLFLRPALMAPNLKPRGAGPGMRLTWRLTHLI
jgi:hypothetical protein